jgi:hypothetical protein
MFPSVKAGRRSSEASPRRPARTPRTRLRRRPAFTDANAPPMTIMDESKQRAGVPARRRQMTGDHKRTPVALSASPRQASEIISWTPGTTKLWPIANLLRTGGRGYSITADDGLWYRYWVFDDYLLISAHCASVHIMNTSAAGSNLFRSALMWRCSESSPAKARRTPTDRPPSRRTFWRVLPDSLSRDILDENGGGKRRVAKV